MKDKQGREYARMSDLKEGDEVTVDGDFTCMLPWSQAEVLGDEDGLYILCEEGQHYLQGQLDYQDDDSLVGIYKGEVKP